MVSKIVQNITPSATCELDGRVREMREAGIDIISLNVGEPDLDTPPNIRDAVKAALDAGRTRYTNVSGILQLRQAICRKLSCDNGITYTPEQICVSTGAKQALNNAVMAVADPGDEVIILMPGWVSYIEIVKLAGATPVCVGTLPDHQPDIDAIRLAITPRTAAVIINSPNNPTGAVYTRKSLEAIAELAVENDLYIISDEVYEKLIYGGRTHVSPASLSAGAYDHTVTVNGMSKAYAMTGFRCGYTAAPPDVAAGISAIQSHTSSNSTTFVQWAAIEALENSGESVRNMVREFEKRRDYALARLASIPGIACDRPDGAFYLFPDISAYFGRSIDGTVINDSFDLCGYLLEKARVAIVPGAAFGAPECVRIAYTNSMANIKEAMDRIEQALALLSPA